MRLSSKLVLATITAAVIISVLSYLKIYNLVFELVVFGLLIATYVAEQAEFRAWKRAFRQNPDDPNLWE